MQNYGHYFEKMWQKLPRRAKDMQKFFDDSLCFGKKFLCIAEVWILFINFAELWVAFFVDGRNYGSHILNQNGTSQSKTWLS